MKFINLQKIDNKRKTVYEEFEETLNLFKQEYNLDIYYNLDNMIVCIDGLDDFPESVHSLFCEKFDVRLQCATRVKQQKTEYNTEVMELVYAPVHHYNKFLEYTDIKI